MKISEVFKQRIKSDIRLYIWPYVGLIQRIKKAVRQAEMEKASAKNFHEYLFACLKIYIAPLVGAVSGFVEYMKHTPQ